MKYKITIGLMAICLFATGARGNEDVRSLIKNVSLDHPRLFVKNGEDEALRRKINSVPALSKAFAHVVSISDAILDAQPVKREMVGRRLLGVSRTCLKRVNYLALAYRVTKDKKYAAKAQEEMMAAAEFSDWNPSHFLDVAEMTAALAIGYDWLYDALDPEARQTIKKAIIEKGLKTSLKGGGWVKVHHNWNQVCHGGLTLGALAVLEDEPGLATQIIKRAIMNVPKAMASYAPDAAYPEGPIYWNYGTTYNVILISALESVLRTDFGLSKSIGFMESSDYYLHVTGPTGLFFNYSDSRANAGVAPVIYWFAAKRKDHSLLWIEQQKLEMFLSETHDPVSYSDRMFPFLIIWSDALRDSPMPTIMHWKGNGKTPVALHRTGWETDRELFVGVKGGSPSSTHAHMDIGSFVMDANGVRWAEDLGMQSYHTLESKGIKIGDGKKQGSQRWNVFRLNNLSHNTLVVDGKKQQVKGHAPIVGFSDKAPMPYTIVDLTTVYKKQLAAAKRGIGLRKDRSVLIQDEIETLDRKTTVRWGMVTRADVMIKEEHRAILRQGDEQLLLSVQSPANAKLELFETAKPPKEYDATNEGTRMIGFKVEIPSSTKEKLVVLLCPGGEVSDEITVQKLADW